MDEKWIKVHCPKCKKAINVLENLGATVYCTKCGKEMKVTT